MMWVMPCCSNVPCQCMGVCHMPQLWSVVAWFYRGPNLDGDSLVDLIDNYKVTVAFRCTYHLARLNLRLRKTRDNFRKYERNVGWCCMPTIDYSRFQKQLCMRYHHAWGCRNQPTGNSEPTESKTCHVEC